MTADSPVPDATAHHPASHAPGRRVGAYKLLEQIGEGGMGTVHLAEQVEPVRRRVALKLIKPGMDSAQVVARFEAERQALALMDHPNIARVLDAGTTDAGRPFFVMELVRGVPITKYCDDTRLTVRDRLELFIPVCLAVQHAHQKGVIHRDIKPSNVLVTLSDGKPVPKVIDFGVAKAIEQPLTERTMFTQAGAVVGTWEYMSPEQADASPIGIDTRSDVYSLGVLLYELLTGTTPLRRERLREAGFSEIVRAIREVEPPRPSDRLSGAGTAPQVAAARREEPARLVRLVRGELDWVVMKALDKDRNRRYDTPNRLADDMRAYLAGEPVKAVPPCASYRLRKFLRRNKGAVAVAAAFVLLLVAAAAVSSRQAALAKAEREVAKAERDRAVAAQANLRKTLVRQVARQMEADLLRLAAVGEALGATVEQGPDWDEKRLEEWKRWMLAKEAQIYGLCVAFEPDTFDPRPADHPGRHLHSWLVPFGFDPADPGRDGYSSYVYRKPPSGEVTAEPLGLKYEYRRRMVYPDSKAPHRPWYRDALAGRRVGWTEPFFDLFGGNIPMVSYTAPIRGRGTDRIIGVLCVDLSLDYFQRRARLKDPTFGRESYGFVISRTGSVISHPHQGPVVGTDGEKAPNIRDLWPDPGFRQLIDRVLAAPATDAAEDLGQDAVGQETGVDPATGRPSRFLFTRFRPTNWVFVAVIPEGGP